MPFAGLYFLGSCLCAFLLEGIPKNTLVSPHEDLPWIPGPD